MSRDNIRGKSFNSEKKISCTPRYVNFFKNVTSFPYYEKKYSETVEKPKKEDLLKTLKNLKPKNNRKLLCDDDCGTDLPLKKAVDSKESILQTRNIPHRERDKMISVNREKVSRKGRDFYNPRKEVCEQLNESSRLSKKMHRNCYDQSQGKHYSKGYFEKFPHASGVTSLEAMSSCSSLDASVYRMKKQEAKLSCKKNKKNPNKIRATRKSSKLSCASLAVNYSPESDFDSYNGKRLEADFKGNDEGNCQCGPESSHSDQKLEGNFYDKKCKDTSNPKTYDCCCEDEEKVKAGCSYYCRCPGYEEESDNYENYSNFQPRFSATPFRKNENHRFAEGETNEEKCKKSPDYEDKNEKIRKQKESSDIKLSDLTPDVPLPTHWRQCGQHMTNVTNEYRDLYNNFKSIQSMAVDRHSRKARKKFTRTYPSGKEFTFEVKPAKDAIKPVLNSRCDCKNCPQLLKSLKDMKFSKNPKKSLILDSYNTLVKSQASKKTDERFSKKATKKCQNQKSNAKNYKNNPEKDPNLERCDCERKIRDKCVDEKYANKEKILKDQKLKLKSDCLNSKDDKLSKTCEEGNHKSQELNKFNFPRIVKPRGASCKVTLKKILVYPPHGEEGPPLSLYKKSSNLNCRIKGDVSKGFRYKVTYKQEFLSPVWHPEEKGSPFRKKEKKIDYG